MGPPNISKSSIFPMGFSMTYPVHLPPAGDSSMTNRLKTVPFRPINLDDSIIPPWSWGNNLHYYYSNIDGHYNQKLYIKLLILQILCEKKWDSNDVNFWASLGPGHVCLS